jgi:hypothetical protein
MRPQRTRRVELGDPELRVLTKVLIFTLAARIELPKSNAAVGLAHVTDDFLQRLAYVFEHERSLLTR